MTFWQITWFFLVGFLLTIYAVLDGFDLGIGIWYAVAKDEKERRSLLNLLGPFWDANEVWLLTGGGALFAAFPQVYATVFSGFYLPLMLVLFGLILRAVAIEFRNIIVDPRWRRLWDRCFVIGSAVPALLFGVALGNILRGLPLDQRGAFAGSFFGLLNPFALLIGILGLAMIMCHSAIVIAVRLDDPPPIKAKRWAYYSWLTFMTVFFVVDIVTATTQSHLFNNYSDVPALLLVPLLTAAAIIIIGVLLQRENYAKALALSSASIVGLMLMAGISLFPFMVPALSDSGESLTIMNSSSSPRTLKIMFVMAILVVPVVISYTVWAYKQFWKHEPAIGTGY